ncbi:hypothetical protein [Haliangium sp.]|uniref:hypothetical protein n=1 Tax=Haliangium sp. TaxID=2663208 RepID=UPI003D0AFB57
MDTRRLRQLEAFLRSAFTAEELRRIARYLPGGIALDAELPGPAASLAAFAHELVWALQRRGGITAELFEILADERSGRRAEITALQQEVLSAVADAGVADTASALEPEFDALPRANVGVFAGRADELARLDAAWDDPGTRLLSLVAWAGVGKSALVRHWLGRLEEDGWRGAEAAYGFSFRAQGMSGGDAGVEEFIEDALAYFGDDAPHQGTLRGRARRLTRLITSRRSLLVLDGLEVLQAPPTTLAGAGALREPTLGALLDTLVQEMNGLCLVTTRLPVQLAEASGEAAVVLALPRLDTASGVALLADKGVRGAEAELAAAVEELEGHALSLSLLGTYLAEVRAGDVRARHDLALLRAADEVDERARAMLAAYDAWLKPRERAVMRLVGLFDRPADAGAVAALRAEPVIAGLTDALDQVDDSGWCAALMLLRRAGLLSAAGAADDDQAASGGDIGRLEAHPLVRAYFAEALEREQPEAWRRGHERLYEHYLAAAPAVPTTLSALAELAQALRHGCFAGRRAEAYAEVYQGRILHGERDAVTRLGAFGLDLGALAGFFERRWDRPASELDRDGQAFVLEAAGFDLRALGRLRDARAPVLAALTRDQAEGRWAAAAEDAGVVSEIELLLGELEAATEHARHGVTLADRSGDSFQRAVRRSNLAEVLACRGELREAESLLKQADRLQKQRGQPYTTLYGLPGARMCELLMDRAAPLDGSAVSVASAAGPGLAEARQRCLAVRRRAETTLGWTRERGLSGFSVAFDRLSLGRALLGLWLLMRVQGRGPDDAEARATLAKAEDEFDAAVSELGRAGRDDMAPRALLARAGLYRLSGDVASARADVDAADDIARPAGMRLYVCDALLERARLALADEVGDWDQAHAAVDEARALVEELGYRRRAPALAILDSTLKRGRERS